MQCKIVVSVLPDKRGESLSASGNDDERAILHSQKNKREERHHEQQFVRRVHSVLYSHLLLRYRTLRFFTST